MGRPEPAARVELTDLDTLILVAAPIYAAFLTDRLATDREQGHAETISEQEISAMAQIAVRHAETVIDESC